MPKPHGKMLYVVERKGLLFCCLELDCLYLEDYYERDISEKELFITDKLLFGSECCPTAILLYLIVRCKPK